MTVYEKNHLRKILDSSCVSCCHHLERSKSLRQPTNDDCENPVELNNLYEWCSENREFKIYNATPSFPLDPTCHPDTTKVLKDIWFRVTPQEENLKLVFSSIDQFPIESKLKLFTLSLYEAECEHLKLYTCTFSGRAGSGAFRSFLLSDLIPNDKYYIGIGTPIDSLQLDSNLFDTIGNFQFCLDSYGLDLCTGFSITTSPEPLIDYGNQATPTAQGDSTFSGIEYTWYIGDSVIVVPVLLSRYSRQDQRPIR